jgi:demethoxyubiquinone hydroxylase (CLK1/Coq7/Cat5 family)
MERFATAIYRVQKGNSREKVIDEKITYAIDNEHEYASNLRNRIIELNKNPSPFVFLFQVAGTLLGLVSRLFSRTCTLKTDVLIEKRAVKDYSYFLNNLDERTKLLIKSIIADEELHIKNWQDSIELIRGK